MIPSMQCHSAIKKPRHVGDNPMFQVGESKHGVLKTIYLRNTNLH